MTLLKKKLQFHEEADELASKILAAAITLRDCKGRDRKAALHQMAGAWKVDRRVKMDGVWKNRALAAIAEDLEAAVCDATLRLGATWCSR